MSDYTHDKKFDFHINSVEDYLDVGIDPGEVKKIVEETLMEKIKPVYVTSYFICKLPKDLAILKD